MKASRLKWAVALGASALVHAGAAAFFVAPQNEVRIAGGQQAGAIVLGDAFEDMALAGEAFEPVETVETIQPADIVEALPAAPAVAQAVPVEPTPAETAAAIQAETVVREAESVSAEQAATAEAERAAVAPVEPAEASRDMTATVALDPPANAALQPSGAAAVEAKPLEPAETEETVAALAPVPVPTPRPDYTPPPPEKAERAKPRPAAKKPAQAGSGGQSQRDARRGASDGGPATADGAAASAQSRTASAAGNAAVSNYPGKIVSRLRRALRYPAEARRNRITGEAQVRFVVSSDGAAQSVTIVRSSGSPILDQAALETVRRAAPFPAIPREAGRTSWPFTVPLAFSR